MHTKKYSFSCLCFLSKIFAMLYVHIPTVMWALKLMLHTEEKY
jgi:hypothetical protein